MSAISRRRAVALAAAASLGTLAALAHTRVAAAGPAYAGPWLILNHLYDLLVVSALLVICYGQIPTGVCGCGFRRSRS